MRIKSLRLKHFRSHADFSVAITRDICVVVGRNTSGKTNLLEALNILSSGKSKRCDKETELISLGKNDASIIAEVETLDKIKLQVIYLFEAATSRLHKKYLRNNFAKTVADFAGNLLLVSFFPEDLKIVINSPGTRREFLNDALFQTDKNYRLAISIYEKAIRSRNAILEKIKQGVGKRQELEYWNEIAIKNGEYITKKRTEFVDFINFVGDDLPVVPKSRSSATMDRPGGLSIRIKIHYDHSIISQDRLIQYAEAEIAATTTLVGPHRDDLQFFEENRNLKTFGSRGEQRMLILFLKLKTLEYIEKIRGEKPILLLDDIFSELDVENRRLALQLISGRQTIITTADEKDLADLPLGDYQTIYLK